MNWKIIVGILLVFGGLAEFFSIVNGQANGDPGIWAKIGCIVLALIGFYLIANGRKERNTRRF